MTTETNFTCYGSITAFTMTENKLKALDFLRKNLIFMKLGTQEDIRRNSGQTIRVWRPTAISAQTTAFNDGGLPSSIQTLAGGYYDATIANYGAYAQPTDLFEMTGRDPGLKKFIEVMQYNAALTLDTLCYTELLNATAYYAGASAGTAATFTSGGNLNATELRKLRKALAAKDAPRFMDSDMFVGVIHPDCAFDLFDETTNNSYGEAYKYEKPDNAIWKGELKPLAGFNLYESNIVSTALITGQGGVAVTAYQNIFTGAGSLINVGLDGLPFNLYYVSPQLINQSNPLGTKGSIGWVAKYAAKYVGDDGPRTYLAYAAPSAITS